MADKPEIIPLPSPKGERLHAADWLAKLDRGNLTSEERKEFSRWLAENPRNKDTLKDLAELWYGLNFPLSRLGTDSQHSVCSVVPIRASSTTISVTRTGFRRAMIACLFAGLVGAAAVWHFTQQQQQVFHHYSTKIGETRTVLLEDGSTIHLNTNSIVQQVYSKSERGVHLLAGEAIFDVAHSKKWPFLVYTSRGQIRAVGTKFAVRIEPNKVSVDVIEGQVVLEGAIASARRAANSTTILSKGEAAELGRELKTMKIATTDSEFEDQLSWAQGNLVFHDRTLQSVVAEVSRYTSVRIEITDEKLKSKKVTGILRIGDVNQMLDGLRAALGVRVKWISPSLVLLTSG